jgi:LacI family transcriptional regulator
MARPTIRDLARAAQVSVATVNRVIAGAAEVREDTAQRVLLAAQDIGFYGLGALKYRVAHAQTRLRLGVIIQTPHLDFAQAMADAFVQVQNEGRFQGVRLHVEVLPDLAPERLTALMQTLAQDCDALVIMGADHPMVADVIDELASRGVPVVALISQLSARSPVHFVGLDSWRMGRTAAWAFHHLGRSPGALGLLVGTHRYRCHDLYESGFRSYFREHAPQWTVLEPLSTFESDATARELTEKLLRDQPGLVGLYVSGGGVQGAMAALRHQARDPRVLLVGHDVLPSTRAGLLDGTLDLVIAHPYVPLAQGAVEVALRAKEMGADGGGGLRVYVPFGVFTRENI